MRKAAPAARPALRRAVLLASLCFSAVAILAPNAAHTQNGTWAGVTTDWNTPVNWTPVGVPTDTATFSNTGVTNVTISQDTPINTIEFTAAAPAYSFTVQSGATFTISNNGIINNPGFEPAFTVNAGSTLAIRNGALAEIRSLAGGGTVTISSSSLLSIVGFGNTTFSGTITGLGTLEIDGAATLSGLGSSIGRLDLCSCDTNGLVINGRVSQRHRSLWHVGRRGNPVGHQWRHAADHQFAPYQLGCWRLFRDAHQRARIDRNREPGRIHRDQCFLRTNLAHHRQWRRAYLTSRLIQSDCRV
jgi:hypothetical protein